MATSLKIIPPVLPEGYCFTSWQQLANDLLTSAIVQFTTNITGVIISQTVPGLSDRDKLWIRVNGDGSPEGSYIFSTTYSKWARPHPIPANSKELRWWKGSLTDLYLYEGGDGIDPGVTAPTLITGSFWKADPDFAARFVLGVGTLPSGTVVNVGDVGGSELATLTAANLPDHTHTYGLRSNDSPGSTYAYGQIELSSASSPQWTPQTSGVVGGAGGSSASHGNMPPYRGAYPIVRTGRQLYAI